MNNKFFLGLLVFPFFSIFIYLLDVNFNGGFLCGLVKEFFEVSGFLSGRYENNFYYYQYSRTVFSLSIFMSPLFVTYWFVFSDDKKFKYFNFIFCLKLFGGVFFLLMLPFFIAFFPVSLGEFPSKRQLAIFNLHRDPILFTVSIYWYLYIDFMLVGLTLKYIFCFKRR